MKSWIANRKTFLEALRSGDYLKGPTRDANGNEPPTDSPGYCAIGLPYTLFLNNEGPTVRGLYDTLGLTKDQIYCIQNEWNDSPLTFPEIADKIETEIFNRRPHERRISNTVG